MNKEIISTKQGISILVMYLVGSTVVLAPWKSAGRDAWIAIIMAMVMSLPMIAIYTRLLLIFPGNDLFDLQQKVFGRFIGKITSFISVWFSVHLCALVFRNFSEFVTVLNLHDTPSFVIAITNGVLCIWIVKGGVEVIGRWSEFFLPVAIAFIGILSLLLIPKMNASNLMPVLYNGINPVINGAISTFIFPFAETFLFTMVFNSLKVKAKVFKTYFLSLIIGYSLMVLSNTKNVMVLGDKLVSSLYFPTYSAASVINIRDFIDRIEVFVAINLFLLTFVKQSICLYVSSVGVAKIFNIKEYRQIVAPIGLLIVVMSELVFSSTMEMFEWVKEVYNYYVPLFGIILPLITLIAAEIKIRSGKHKEDA